MPMFRNLGAAVSKLTKKESNKRVLSSLVVSPWIKKHHQALSLLEQNINLSRLLWYLHEI